MTLIKKVEIDIGVKGDAASKAKLDGISARAEELKKAFPEYELKINSAAAAERIKVFKDELRSIPNETTAKVKVKVDSSALDKLSKSGFLKPSLLGSAVALSPALIPLAGGIAGAVGAIGASFGAAGLAAGLFGLTVKTVLTGIAANSKKLATAQAAVANATTAATRKTAAANLKNLTSGWSPDYKKIIAEYQVFTTKWQSVSQAIAVPALVPWLDALTRGMNFLKPLLTPVAQEFTAWGQAIDKYFKSKAGSTEIHAMAVSFGQFASLQLANVVQFIRGIGSGIHSLGHDLSADGVYFGAFGDYLAKWGTEFAAWAKSKQARADVSGFLAYMHKNGGLIVSIMKDLGKILPGIFQGVSATGTLELQAITGLLGFIAKLPKGWQAPLTEAAGAILLLSKTGVLKVGFTVVGAAAGWVKKLLGGASVDIGGGAAAAEIRTAMVSGGSAAAAEIRAAMAGGAAASAGEGAAGGAAAGGVAARTGLPSLGALATYAAGAGGIVAGLFLRIREDAAGGIAGIGRDIPKALSGTTGFLQIAASGWSDTIVGRFEKPVRALFVRVEHNIANAFDIIRHAGSSKWDAMWGDVTSRGKNRIAAVVTSFDGFRHSTASRFDGIRHDIAAAWNTIWSNTVTRVRSGISTVVGWFRGLPGRAVGALFGLGHSLAAFASAAIGQMWSAFRNTFASVIHWFQGLPSKILHALGVHSPPGWAVSAGKWIMKGLHIGLGHGLGQLTSFTTSIGAQVAGALSGALGGHMGDSGARTHSAAVAQAYARSLLSQYGWSANQMSSLIPLWNQESGWSAYAVNQSSGAYGIPQSLGHGHPYNLGDYKNQIVWGLNYIRGRYGSPAAAERHELAYNWYDKGGWLMPGLTLAMNKTGRPEQILPPGGSSGGVVKHVFEIRAPHGATQLERAVAEMIRHTVTVNGGDVQSALGRT